MKRDLYYKNIPGLKDNLEPLLNHSNKMRILKDVSVPYFVWTGSGPIEKLETFSLPLSVDELHFYMYEPLGLRSPDYQGRSFEGELLGEISFDSIESNDLNSIEKFVIKNNLKNVKVFVCDYNIQKLQNKYQKLNLHCLDFFLRSVNYYEEFNSLENNFTKKFWCGNWRYVPHRHIMTAYLTNYPGNYSWNLKCNFETIEKNNWFDFKKIDSNRLNKIKKGIEILENNIFVIDQQADVVEVKDSQSYYAPLGAPQISKKLIESYKECFCAVINESRYASPLGYLSEKTLTAINCKLPFLLVAAPYTLEYLKRFGFKTFDKWWSEDYDKEIDHQKRMLMLFDIIDYINSKSLLELKSIYQEMLPILNHNLEVLKTIPNNKIIL